MCPWRKMRLWAWYGRDRYNDDDDWWSRTGLGVAVNDFGNIGFAFAGYGV